ERALLERLRQARRAAPEREGPAAVLAYHDLVNDHVFFLHDAAERLRRLYDAYKAHPKLSAAVAGEIAGAPYAAVARPRRRARRPGRAPRLLPRGPPPSPRAAELPPLRARLAGLPVGLRRVLPRGP